MMPQPYPACTDCGCTYHPVYDATGMRYATHVVCHHAGCAGVYCTSCKRHCPA